MDWITLWFKVNMVDLVLSILLLALVFGIGGIYYLIKR